MMRLSRLILCGLFALAVTATTATAGPLRQLVQRVTHRGGCGCESAPQPRATTAPPPVVVTSGYSPAVVMPQMGEVRLVRATSYDGLGVPVDAAPYQPIRMGGGLVPVCPTCPGGVCR